MFNLRNTIVNCWAVSTHGLWSISKEQTFQSSIMLLFDFPGAKNSFVFHPPNPKSPHNTCTDKIVLLI